MSKVFCFQREQCPNSLQNKIERRENILLLNIANPMYLLKEINQHVINYVVSIIFHSFRIMANVKQKENESLQE
jgi:hypothetical protein